MNTISISKRNLWRYVNIKIKRAIHHYHVFSVISILFEELTKDLLDNKIIKIKNLGNLMLKQMPSRKYHNVRTRQMEQTSGYRIIRLFLTTAVSKKICKSLDLKIDQNE